MEIKDYEQKMKYVMDFYDQATQINQMVRDNIKGFHYFYLYDFYNEREVINPKLKELVEKRRRQLLIELGRVGEYAIKYLLLLEQIHKYPNQSIEQFTEKFIYYIGDKKGVRNTYINQYHLDPNIINEILTAKEKHSLQPLHDYSFLFTILEKLFPNVVTHLHENILFNIKGYNCIESKFLTKDEAYLASFFSSIHFLESIELSNEANKEYLEEYKNIIEESGDVFTKLRYLENNTEKKQYDMINIVSIMYHLVDYIVLIHEYNNDNPENNIEVAYIKKKIDEHILPQAFTKYEDSIYTIPKYKKDLERREETSKKAGKVLDKYPELLNSIDFSQLKIWSRFNNNEINSDFVISDFIDNLIEFGNKPEAFSNNYPLLLPTNHILEVEKYLKEIGIDISSIEKEQSSILCVPIDYLKKGYESINSSDVSVSLLISAIDKILYEEGMSNNSVPELPLRHR